MNKISLFFGILLCGLLSIGNVPTTTLADTKDPVSITTPDTFPPDIQRIIQRGTLIVAIHHNDIPPFIMTAPNGNLYGFDIDIARGIARRLGVKLIFDREATTYDGVINEVIEGHADIAISLLSSTLPRALHVGFTDPYLILKQALLFNRLQAAKLHWYNPTQINTLLEKNNKGIRIGILDDSSYVFYAQEDYPNATFIKYDDMNQAMQDVVSGKIFGVLYNEILMGEWLKRNPNAILYARMHICEEAEPIAIATQWQDIYLLNWLNIYLATIRQNGVEQLLEQTYFKFDRSPP